MLPGVLSESFHSSRPLRARAGYLLLQYQLVYSLTTAKDLHPDKINHPGVPARAKYVCAQVLSALRYFFELYNKVHRGGGVPTVNPPCAQDFISYNWSRIL